MTLKEWCDQHNIGMGSIQADGTTKVLAFRGMERRGLDWLSDFVVVSETPRNDLLLVTMRIS